MKKENKRKKMNHTRKKKPSTLRNVITILQQFKKRCFNLKDGVKKKKQESRSLSSVTNNDGWTANGILSDVTRHHPLSEREVKLFLLNFLFLNREGGGEKRKITFTLRYLT